MILLRPDCLVFRTSDGEQIPCSAYDVTVELISEADESLDEELIRNAAEAVLHYFKTELGQTAVSVGEFSLALAQALRTLGLNVTSAEPDSSPPVAEADLPSLAAGPDTGFELLFFSRLRAELRRHLESCPQVVRFRGLRCCVKQLAGAKRWNRRCRDLNDQIVEYLRTCLGAEKGGESCALVVL